MQQLNKPLYYAFENVPYYRKIFDERRFNPEDIKSLNDLEELAYLTK